MWQHSGAINGVFWTPLPILYVALSVWQCMGHNSSGFGGIGGLCTIPAHRLLHLKSAADSTSASGMGVKSVCWMAAGLNMLPTGRH